MDDRVLQATVRENGVVHFQFGVPGNYQKGDIQSTSLAADIGHMIAYGRGEVRESLYGSSTKYLVLPIQTETRTVVTGAKLPNGLTVSVPDELDLS